MPGVIQPQRPPSFMNTAMSLGQTAMQAKSAFGGGGNDPSQTDPTTPTAGQQPDPTQMMQGNAIQRRINSYGPSQGYNLGLSGQSGQGNGGY